MVRAARSGQLLGDGKADRIDFSTAWHGFEPRRRAHAGLLQVDGLCALPSLWTLGV